MKRPLVGATPPTANDLNNTKKPKNFTPRRRCRLALLIDEGDAILIQSALRLTAVLGGVWEGASGTASCPCCRAAGMTVVQDGVGSIIATCPHACNRADIWDALVAQDIVVNNMRLS